MRALCTRFSWLAAALCLTVTPASALIWPSAVRAIERDLAVADVGVRRRAAHRLRELPRAALARALLRAVDDGDVEVRLAAAQAAQGRTIEGLSERVVAWLTETDVRLRIAAAELLTSAPVPRAVAPLARALSDSEPAVRRAAAGALAVSGSSDAVISLLGRLDDSVVEVRQAVVRALSDLGDARAVVPLISKIEDSRPEMRRSVARALGNLGDARATSALVLALRDPDPSVRVAALDALSVLGQPGAATSIAALLASDPVPAVRRAAISALALLGGPGAITALIEALPALPEEREAIAAAFARIGPSAAPALASCLRAGGDSEKMEGCALALAGTRAPEAGALIREALERGSIDAEVGLRALAGVADPEALAKCLAFLSHPDPGVRRAALDAAAPLLDPRQADGRAVEPLELAFEHAQGRRSERLDLIRLLGRTGSPRAARTLMPIAEHADDLAFRLAALAALAEVGSDAAQQTFLKALSDPEAAVRLAAALAIRRSRPRGMELALLDLLERAAAQDRVSLALALAGALAGSSNEQAVARAAALMLGARGAERDALIEALARAPSAAAQAALEQLSAAPDAADRAKLAEVLGARKDGAKLLARLLGDQDPRVRANAAWSLGVVGAQQHVPLLLRAAQDPDVSVAADAAQALGRIAARERLSLEAELCGLVAAPRGAVRAGALSSLRILGKRCPDGRERRTLSTDRLVAPRLAAARLLAATSASAEDRRALVRCANEDPVGAVAAACMDAREAVKSGDRELLVFVVPAGEPQPVPGAAFALARPDGLVRHGSADRRGAVLELALPEGDVELGVPAALGE